MPRGDPVRGFALTLFALGALALAVALVALGAWGAAWWASAALVGVLLLAAGSIYFVLPARAGHEALVGTALRASGTPALLLGLLAVVVHLAGVAADLTEAGWLAGLAASPRLVELPAAGATFFVAFGLAARAWHGGSSRMKNPQAMRLVFAAALAALALGASAI